MKLDKFVLALTGVVFIAYIFPQASAGRSGEILGYVSTVGISLIFFFYGLRLSPEKIRLGLKNWKLHLLVQSATFLLFPLIILIFYPFLQNERQEVLWLGLFFLAAVPSTVSSSVIMVSIGKGNIPAAIFNASISGIAGVVLTPLWMGIFLQQTGVEFDFTHIYIRLITGIILPVIVGVLLQRWWHGFALKYGNYLARFDQSVIILILYMSFAKSFNDSVFNIISFLNLAVLGLLVVALFFVVYGLIYIITRLLKFNREDTITALFCGSQKSLVHGTVFSKILLSGFYAAGIVLLPLMLYHIFQLFVTSIIAARYGRDRKDEK